MHGFPWRSSTRGQREYNRDVQTADAKPSSQHCDALAFRLAFPCWRDRFCATNRFVNE